MSSLITVDELRAEPDAPGIFEIAAVREVRLSGMLMAYVVAGLGFMLLPGTFLGVWNLITISSHHAAGTASLAWVQAHGHAQIFGWIGTFILASATTPFLSCEGRSHLRCGRPGLHGPCGRWVSPCAGSLEFTNGIGELCCRYLRLWKLQRSSSSLSLSEDIGRRSNHNQSWTYGF